MMLRTLIGQVLRRTRTAQGKTLREVCELAGVSIGHLSEVERGRKEPSSELLDAICRALGLTLFELLLAVLREVQQQPRRVEGRFEIAQQRPRRVEGRFEIAQRRRGDFRLAA
ncbi:helix-turn-helix domain-containing protein [Actinoplanes sp. CA-054009]